MISVHTCASLLPARSTWPGPIVSSAKSDNHISLSFVIEDKKSSVCSQRNGTMNDKANVPTLVGLLQEVMLWADVPNRIPSACGGNTLVRFFFYSCVVVDLSCPRQQLLMHSRFLAEISNCGSKHSFLAKY